MSILEGYLTEAETAAQLRLTPRTLKRYRALRQGPPFTVIGQRKRYNVEEVRKWLASRQINPVRNRNHPKT
jgi:hypothetical protein